MSKAQEAEQNPGAPAGDGGRTSTSNQSGDKVEIASYTVPDGRTARLDTLAGSGDELSRVEFSVAGETFGPFDGEHSPEMGWDGAFLAEGETVTVEGFSEDGTDVEIEGMISAREL